MTKEERRLWYNFLRGYSVRFYRQKILGKFIVDFYCAKAKLVIELDGTQHFFDRQKNYDDLRTEYLSQYGISVLRIPNNEINEHFDAVCEYIDRVVKNRLPES